MKPKEISLLIEKELGGDYSITNAHACDLSKCLIRPKRRKVLFLGGSDPHVREVWIVLEERPDTLNGFKVFFDEESRTYGLVEDREPYGLAYNVRNSFIEAFKLM